jgi:hypothetical protein
VFYLVDFSFRGPCNIRLPHEEALDCKVDEIKCVIITFQIQKNGQHGEHVHPKLGQESLLYLWRPEYSLLLHLACGLAKEDSHGHVCG